MPAKNDHYGTQARRVRQAALREQLENGGHLQHVLDLCEKLENDPDISVPAISKVIDTKMRLIGKYLPDLKSMELTGDPENPVPVKRVIEFVRPEKIET